MLARLKKALKDNDQGFTLIELLVVIVIIGILAAIAIPVFLSQREKGVEAGIKSDLKAAATAQETAYVDTAAYVHPTPPEFRASEGNEIVSEAAGDGYCIEGRNDGTSTVFSYRSSTGAITETAC